MSSAFSAIGVPVGAVPFGSPTSPAIAAVATGSGNLTEKSLELTFCAQFAVEIAHHHFYPHWPHRMVWFGLTQLQENALGFDAAISLGGVAVIFQFKASHTITKTRGRRFKVEHGQMAILQGAFGAHPGTCYYVFPDIGTVAELVAVQSNVTGNSWLVDVAALRNPLPQPLRNDGRGPRKDNCHFAYLGKPPTGSVEFHSDPFSVSAYRAKGFAQRLRPPERFTSTVDVVRLLKAMQKESPTASRKFFRNAVMAIIPEPF